LAEAKREPDRAVSKPQLAARLEASVRTIDQHHWYIEAD
jgi:hypothetical protein